MAEDRKNDIVDLPEGRLELSLRVLGNELIGVKMLVDDMKMKWVVVGSVALVVLLWAAATSAPVLKSIFGA